MVELAIRIGSYGRRPQDFAGSGWNVFDFVVIGAAFVPGLTENSTLLRLVPLRACCGSSACCPSCVF